MQHKNLWVSSIMSNNKQTHLADFLNSFTAVESFITELGSCIYNALTDLKKHCIFQALISVSGQHENEGSLAFLFSLYSVSQQ